MRRMNLAVLGAAVLAILLTGSCDSNPSGPKIVPDTVSVTATSLSATLRAGGDSTTQSFSVTGNRAGIPWTAASSAEWIRLGASAGVTPSDIAVLLSSSNLAPGEHSAFVTVEGTDADNGPINLAVRLTVLPQPILTVSPAALEFGGTVGQGDIATAPILISNTGSGALTWTVATTASWLRISPLTGTAPTIAFVTASAAELAAGVHQATITITGSDGLGSPKTVPVTLTLAERPRFTVSTSTAPVAGGTVTGAGTFTPGSTATLTATPAADYDFLNWSENGTVVSNAATLSFTVTADRTLVANFVSKPQPVAISTSSNPPEGGTTTGAGNYMAGSTATVAATPNSGYTFNFWTDGGTFVSSDASYSFTATANRDLVANFTPTSQATVTITILTSPADGGTTTGQGIYSQGALGRATATPNPGYVFAHWTEHGNQTWSVPFFSFVADTDRTFIAIFRLANPDGLLVNTASNPTNGGTTSGGGRYTPNTVVTVNATPSAGYTFVNWTENGAAITANASYSFTVTSERNLVANFAKVSETGPVTITTSANPTGGGTTTGGGSYAQGATVTVNASPTAGFVFTHWTDNGVQVATTPSYSFTASSSRELVAHFAAATAPSTVTITTSSTPTNGGTTSGGGTYAQGGSVTVTAVPNSGFSFRDWRENGVVVSTAASYSFTAISNRALVASFGPPAPSYTITTESFPTEGGTTSGGGVYDENESVTVIATPGPSYTFSAWTQNGAIVSTSAVYTFPATSTRTITANFAGGGPVIIRTFSAPPYGGTTSGGGTYPFNSLVTVTAYPANTWDLHNWTKGSTVPTSSELTVADSYTFLARESADYLANFRQWVVIEIVSPAGNATVGDTVNITVRTTPTVGSLRAVVADRETALAYNSATGLYTGTLNLAGLPQGELQLVIHAVSGARNATVSQPIIHSSNVVISSSVSPAGSGTTTGSGSYSPGASVQMVATANPGFAFSHWSENGVVVAGGATYAFTATQNRALVAHFVSQ
jgi:hypothetical protein